MRENIIDGIGYPVKHNRRGPISTSPALMAENITGILRSINDHNFGCPSPKMNAAPIFSSLQSIPNPYHSSKTSFIPKPAPNPRNISTKNSPSTSKISAVTELSAFTSDPAQPELTWQIVIGALAGVTPFVVAGIEFSKRIVAQKKCNVCKGSGLVLRDNKYYFRCPRCGGFLPWQSWRRFFIG